LFNLEVLVFVTPALISGHVLTSRRLRKRIRVYPCPSYIKLTKPLPMQGFLDGWTATVSGTVSNRAD
jgi:hypothetical protein